MTTESTATHCGRAVVELGALRGCRICRRLFRVGAGADLVELAGPIGVRARWRTGDGAATAGYRNAAAPSETVIAIERFWLAHWAIPAVVATFVTCFLLLWGGVVGSAGLGLVDGTVSVSRVTATLAGLAVLCLAVGFAYLAAALFVNRTTIEISPRRVVRRDGPLRWRSPVVVERHAGDGARAESRPGNDVRNLGARWPPPKVFAVVLAGADGIETAVLVEQIGLESSARRIGEVVDEVLRATRDV